MTTADVNLLGTVHGGVVMKLVDDVAGAVAQRHSGGPAVTVALDEMTFLVPVRVGAGPSRTRSAVRSVGRSRASSPGASSSRPCPLVGTVRPGSPMRPAPRRKPNTEQAWAGHVMVRAVVSDRVAELVEAVRAGRPDLARRRMVLLQRTGAIVRSPAAP